MRLTARVFLAASVAAVSVLPLGSTLTAAPVQQGAGTGTTHTRWSGVDGPALGQADAEPTAVSQRVEDGPVVVHGTNMVAADITAADVLAAVQSVTADDTSDRRAAPARRVKVGVIGYFDAALLKKQIRAKQVPPVPADQRVCFVGTRRCPFGTPGARTANLAIATLPTASSRVRFDLHLAEAATLPAMRRAIRWMADHDVEILVPLALVPWDDSGDGTGPAGRLLAEAVDAGMFVVTAAGDSGVDRNYDFYNGSYNRTVWRDDDGDDWLDFRTDDESLGAYCGALYGLRWNDWGGRATDYDLYVSDATRTANGLVDGTDRRLIGGRDQSKRGVDPLEANDFRWLCNHDPRRGPVYDRDGDNFVSLWVHRTRRSSEPATRDVLEVMVLNGWLEYASGSNNTQDTWAVAADPGVVTVGALIYAEPTWFTPSAPTNDGRQKPDIAAESCVMFRRNARCDGEGSDQDDGVFRSTAIAAGGGAGGVAAWIAGYEPATTADLRFLLRLLSTQIDADAPWGVDPQIGWGRPSYTAPPPDADGAAIGVPVGFFREVRSPRGTDADLDRTFTTVTKDMVFEQIDYMGDAQLAPATAVVTVTNARRAGTVQIWGRGQVPSEAVTVHFDKAKGAQSKTIVLRDIYGLWVRVTTGGDVSIGPAPSLYLGTDKPGYATLDPRVTIRQESDGVLAADTPFAGGDPGWMSLVGTTMAAVTIVSPSSDGVVRYQRRKIFEFEKGRTFTFYGPGSLLDLLSASVPVRLDVEIIGMFVEETSPGWRRASSSVDVSLPPGVDRVVDLGLPAGGSRGTSDVHLFIETRASQRGSVSAVDDDGRLRRLGDHRPGRDTVVATVRAVGGRVTLRATSRVRLTVRGFAYTVGTQRAPTLIAPPDRVGYPIDASADGLVIGASRGQERINIWDRSTNTVRTIDTVPGTTPDPPSELIGVANDGSAIAYTVAGAPVTLVVHDLATNTRDVYPMPFDSTSAIRLKANGDLTVFLVAGSARVFRVHEGALQETTFSPWSIHDMDDSGTRFLASASSTIGSKIIDIDGKVVQTLGTTPAYALSGDGRSVVNSAGEIVTDGQVRWEMCPDMTDPSIIGRASLDRTADHVLFRTSCGGPGVELYTPTGTRRLSSNSGLQGLISGDGSTAIISDGRRVIGVVPLDE